MTSLKDYDTLECPHCDQPTKPKRVSPGGSVRYWHDCPDGVRYSWTINREGEMVNESQVLSPTK